MLMNHFAIEVFVGLKNPVQTNYPRISIKEALKRSITVLRLFLEKPRKKWYSNQEQSKERRVAEIQNI